MKRIAIFTQFWGEQYTNLFYRYLLPSMMQDGNLPKLVAEGYDVKWNIYSPTPPKVDSPLFIYHPNTVELTIPCLTDFINSNLDAVCFMIYPDIFVGNNTIYNSIKLVENKPNLSLCVAHPRISLQKLNGIPIPAKSNAQLVDFAFKYSHKCLWGAEDNLDLNMTWGGISWRKIDENNYAVIHNIATPWVFQFRPGDAEYICVDQGGCMDRGFVRKLKAENRIKLCGSSDLCFFVEITNDSHSPELRSGLKFNDRAYMEIYEKEGYNNWNEFIVNWRRE